MKNVFLSIAFVLIAQMSMAQDANFKADVLKLISISGADAQMKVVKPQILNMIPEVNKENFSKAFEDSMPKLLDRMASIYMEIYTHEDVKKMIVFYESPVGKKMNKNAGELTQKSFVAGQEWAKELQGIMAKYKDVNSVQVPTSVSDNTVYNTAGIEVKPDFPGGMDQFYKFIAENYQTPKVEGLKGKIYVTFVIEKDGSLSDIKVLRDIGYGTGKEAIRVLKLSPKWSSGEQNGQKVRCTYSLPISIGAK
ncbi:DUF2059 domain-containing protein [Flavobacterium alvei]|uniref:DUF2059 domain-containing protein n=1 Tax=Flavobacterium alvei TaxID=2080416 RepID=UPI0026F1E261|nr:DUF2059 domain-containing protein [Flavobacterium alvei]